jgi:hypothetical protein
MKAHNNFGTRCIAHKRAFLTERQFLRFAVDFQEDNMTKREMIYARFEAFEEEIAHCYFLLHERFIIHPELSKFWAETAIEELQHHSILRFCREHGLMADVEVDSITIEHVQEIIETVVGVASDPDVSVDEAFYAALLIESSEVENIYEKLIAALAKDRKVLFDAIQASLRAHHASIAEAASRFCSDRGFAEAFRNLERRVS